MLLDFITVRVCNAVPNRPFLWKTLMVRTPYVIIRTHGVFSSLGTCATPKLAGFVRQFILHILAFMAQHAYDRLQKESTHTIHTFTLAHWSNILFPIHSFEEIDNLKRNLYFILYCHSNQKSGEAAFCWAKHISLSFHLRAPVFSDSNPYLSDNAIC